MSVKFSNDSLHRIVPGTKNLSRSFRAFALMTGMPLLLALDAMSQTITPTVHLNVDDAALTNMEGVLVARDRLSRAGSVDQMLFVLPNPAGYPSADNVGFSGGFVGSSHYDFLLSYNSVDKTYSFTLSNGAVSGNVSFLSGGANRTISYSDSAAKLNYNIIHLYGASTTAGSSVSFQDLYFTPGSGLSTTGSLETSGNATAGITQPYHQWLAAPTGTNLASYDWTVGARVTLTAGGTNPSSGEGIKFEVSTKSGEFSPTSPGPDTAIPEPMVSLMCLLGLVVGISRRSRA